MNRSTKVLQIFIITILLFITVGASGFLVDPPTTRDFHLQAESPQFWNLVDHNAKLSVVGTGFGFTEGPVWDEAGFLYVSDETINKIFRLHLEGKKEEG